MANARKSVAHVFNENPDSLEFNELVFDNYMDMLTDLDKDSLISLIKKEAETQAAEIESDVSGHPFYFKHFSYRFCLARRPQPR